MKWNKSVVLLVVIGAALGITTFLYLKLHRAKVKKVEKRTFQQHWATLNYVNIEQLPEIAVEAHNPELSRRPAELTATQHSALVSWVNDFFNAFSHKSRERALSFLGFASLNNLDVDSQRRLFVPCSVSLGEQERMQDLGPVKGYMEYWEYLSSKVPEKICFESLDGVGRSELNIYITNGVLSPDQLFSKCMQLPGVRGMQQLMCSTSLKEMRDAVSVPDQVPLTAMVTIPVKYKLTHEEVGPIVFYGIWSEEHQRWFPLSVYRGAVGMMDISKQFPL
jgi:hypothetical protein